MALSGDLRAQAIYNVIAANDPNFGQASAAEKAALLSGLKNIYGADTTYLKGATVVNPTAFAVPAGIGVATTGSAAAQTGSTTAPGSVTGTGTIS